MSTKTFFFLFFRRKACYNEEMRNYLLGIVSVLILTAVVGGAYYFGVQKSTPGLQEVPATPTKISVADISPSTIMPSPSPTSPAELEIDVSEQIIAAMTSKNTQALEGYMADTVEVRLEASGCCGSITKAEALSQLSYLDPAVGWDFNPTNPILINLAAAVPDYYGSNWIVGVASNEYLVSFKLNNQNKIEAYNLAQTYKLLTP